MTQVRDNRCLPDRTRAWLASAALCLCLSLVVGCGCLAGYTVGPSGLYDSGIKTVYVPMIEANTYRKDFGERLTEAIVKKITEQTPYSIGSPSSTDSVLTVTLTGETQKVTARNRYNDTRQKIVELTATAVWTDVRGVVAKNPSSILSPNSGVSITSQSYLVPEMGQSSATSQQEAIDKLADEIVGLMESDW